MPPSLEILCEDAPVVAVNKPAGVITQGAPPGVDSLADLVREYLKRKYSKPGNVYLGLVHRLDRPVSGVVVFARNSKAAARLSEQFREHRVRKVYHAVVERLPDPESGTLTDWLLRDRDAARVRLVPAETPGAREAVLHYRTLGRQRGRAWLEIEPATGRMHQIRVQLAARGWAIVGDHKYGARTELVPPRPVERWQAPIALHARSLTLKHPIRYDDLTIAAPLPEEWDQLGFGTQPLADAATAPDR
ncbi:MAG TPA: RNA pseudouridine synthase [Planctomycetaceae bacterium]|nr:RNA pseudouridine synthase [Planctomycetaceae bacterium]